MKHSESMHEVSCGCRSAGECHHNDFTWKVALDACVDAFAKDMKAKLCHKFLQGKSGWDDPNWQREDVIEQLRNHIDKGDMVDVANFAMFAWNKQ